MRNLYEPGLVVDAGCRKVDLLLRQAKRLGNQGMAVLHAVAQPYNPHAAGPADGTASTRSAAADDDPVRLVDLLEDGACEVTPEGRVELDLPAYGYRWLRVVRPGSRRLL